MITKWFNVDMTVSGQCFIQSIKFISVFILHCSDWIKLPLTRPLASVYVIILYKI